MPTQSRARARPGRARGRARPRRRPRRAARYAVVYDVEGPRIRLGVLWLAASVCAVGFGAYTAVPLYAFTAAAAAVQAARAAPAWPLTIDRRIVGVIAAGLVVAAGIHDTVLGLALLGVAALTYYLGLVRGRLPSAAAGAARLLELGMLPGLAGAGVVLTARHSTGAALALVAVTAAYETGDYLVGSGASNALEGPLAGAVSALVVSFSIGAIGVPPFELPGVLVYGVAAAVLCPLGQLLASALLPSPAARAPALRRIDSLLVLAPLWAALTIA